MKTTGKIRMRNRTLLTTMGAMLFLLTTGFLPPPDADLFFKVNRGIEVFGHVYKDVATNYVDVIDPERFMQAGIAGMLGTLDPYTVFIDKEDGDEVDLLTSGKYGGIGVTIGMREGAVRVISVMDGYSAQRQGVIPGDKFLEVDGVSVTGKKPDEVRMMTRGEPGTEVRVRVEREGEKKPLDFALIREEIKLKNVTYADFVSEGIGYIRLERFSRLAGEEVRQSIKDMKLKGELKGVILDLRGNPGGLLDAAVDVVSKFVPRGTLVVRTNGRRSDADKEYVTTEEPLLPGVPMVCLTDRGSASASEIVCGSLQDLDRALIVGIRTFGKGLVQTILPLEDGAQLKITTARYYIPSGRSIQEIDYMHRDGNGVFLTMSDSAKRTFKTAHGRRVYEHGGISPDSVVIDTDPGPMVRELQRKALVFKFANTYFGEHRHASTLGVTDSVMEQFRIFLRAEKFEFQEESSVRVRDLKHFAEEYHYGKELSSSLEAVDAALKKEQARGFDRYADHIRQELATEFAARVKGEVGRIGATLKDDGQLQTAVGVLKNKKVYSGKLGMI